MSRSVRHHHSGAAADAQGIHRRVVQLMGMPISLALRGRHADSVAGQAAWETVVTELEEVDRVFTTYRDDSYVSRLDAGQVTLEMCPPEVTEVLDLGAEAEAQSDGAFPICRRSADGSIHLDPSGAVKGWAGLRASRLVAALDDTDFCLSAGGDLICRAADDREP